MKLTIKFGFDQAADHSRIHRIIRIDLSRQEIRQCQERFLERLLFRYRDFLSTDPKDKIYSLFGLVEGSDLAWLNLEVNYHLETHVVYRRFATALLKAKGNLDILSACRIPTERDSIDFLPSWVPDWRLPDKTVPLLLQGFSQEGSISFESTRSSTYIPSFSEDGNMFCLEGHFLAQILKVGWPLPPPTEYSKFSVISIFYREFQIERAINSWKGVVSLNRNENSRYINGEFLVDAFWQTLVAGHYGPGGFEAAKTNFHNVYVTGPLNIHKYLPSLPLFFDLLRGVFTVIPILIIEIISILIRGFESRKGESSKTEFFKRAIHATSGGWAMAKTAEGYIALVPTGTQPGDEIGLCKGGSVPLILRRNGLSWQLIGECYVHGVMQGEAFDESHCISIWVS